MRRSLWIVPVLLLLPLVASAKPKRGDAWVYLEDHDSTHMSGSMSDIDAARAQQKHADEKLLYVRRGARAWVIRDPALLSRVVALWAPANEVGKKMEAVGKKMQAVGSRQEAIGAKMGPLGERMGELGAEMGRLRHDDPAVDRIQKEMDELSAKMDVLSKQMDAISKEMDPFSREMDVMSKEMDRITKRAEAEQGTLVDDAIARGIAVEIK